MISVELGEMIKQNISYYKDKTDYFRNMDFPILAKDYSEICDLLEKVLNDKATVWGSLFSFQNFKSVVYCI